MPGTARCEIGIPTPRTTGGQRHAACPKGAAVLALHPDSRLAVWCCRAHWHEWSAAAVKNHGRLPTILDTLELLPAPDLSYAVLVTRPFPEEPTREWPDDWTTIPEQDKAALAGRGIRTIACQVCTIAFGLRDAIFPTDPLKVPPPFDPGVVVECPRCRSPRVAIELADLP